MEISGQITVVTAGVAVQGPAIDGPNFLFKAHPDNTGKIWVGNVNGTVTVNNGYPLEVGDSPLIMEVSGLEHLWFNASANNQKVCWIKIEV